MTGPAPVRPGYSAVVTETEIAANAVAPPPTPLRRRVRDTFMAPRALAAAVRERAPWVDVLLLATAVAVLAAAFLPPDVFLDAARDATTRRGEPVEVISSPEEIVRWGRYLAMLSALAIHPLTIFAIAGVLALAFTVLGGSRVRFVEYLSLTAHASLITAAGTSIGVVAALAAAGPTGRPTLGALVSGEGPVARSLEAVDPFTVWMLAVIAVGIAELGERRGAAAVGTILVGGYLLAAFGSVWLAA